MGTRSLLLLAAALLLAASTIAHASPAAPPAAIRVRDYAKADCIADDTAAIKQAIADWQTASKTTGLLDFGAGCYRTTDTLHFGGNTDTGFHFGEIRGDSSVLAQIHPDAGVSPAATFYNVKYSSIHGLGFRGVNKAGIGLLLTHTPPGSGMGTNNLTIQDINVQNFDTCVQMGGDASGYGSQGAAAGITWIQLTASSCHTGIAYFAFNTLDTTFLSTSLGQNDVGVDARNAHQMFFKTGSGSGNGTTFWFHSTGNYVVDGWRDESAADHVIKAGCCGAGTFVTVRDSMFYGCDPSRSGGRACVTDNNWGSLPHEYGDLMPVIESYGDGYLLVEQSFIGGRIAVNPKLGSTILLNNAIYDTSPWVAGAHGNPQGSGMYYRTEGNYRPIGSANLAESNPIYMFPPQSGFAVNGKPSP